MLPRLLRSSIHLKRQTPPITITATRQPYHPKTQPNMAETKGARELQKLFQNIQGAAGDSWEETLLDSARRVSAPLAIRMLDQIGLNKDTAAAFRILDNGCGVGVVASELQSMIKPEVLQQSSILCGDFSEPIVGLVQKRIEEEGWINTEMRQIDAQNIDFDAASFTHVTMNIGFHVVPDSEAALNEALRILKPGGTLGFTTWHRTPGWAPDLQAAFKSFPFEAPLAVTLQTSKWGDWADVNWVRETLEDRGLQDVKVEVLAHLGRVDSAEHFTTHFAMMTNWTMNSCWSEELRKEHPAEEVHGLVRDFLENKYEGKGWDMTWVSIIASGRVPA
ncbi:S-adenosyl-L-methionine-dependent methyltransferase [Lasiosphaeris hirsuta]|uniref:S-adenosyl-L-methionine-dependent methyltransferase n=1 Tax=Lasiosphaeris hirsuta TaxID=260670 RepID=A0AA40AG54_9PEZI|nr:S-adenosyl-L-methionine-dependent methyltransferase [Lasiosphaeris hirsuta]